VALILGVAPNLPGFLAQAGFVESVPACFESIYTYAWFVGFLLSALLYVVLTAVRR
jgi:NCS1 family nucleobase:cation symporter-1